MSFGTYRQYDSRWGRKNYNGSSSYATAGCGPTSCANILHAINPKITPVTTGNFMKSHGYAIRNNGTAWNGIPACLKHFGAQDVKQVDKMTDVFKLCSKGYVGVFLFRKGRKGGVTWTTSGHYVAITGYKYQNKKHYFRTFDSGGRKHDGWYCYETQMKGLIPRIWLCKIPTPKPAKPLPKPKPTYTGKLPAVAFKKGAKGDHVKLWQKFLNWYHPAWKLTVDGKFGNNTDSATKMFQKNEGLTPDGIVGAKTIAKAKTYTAKTAPVAQKKTTPVKTTPKKTNTTSSSSTASKGVAWARSIAKGGKYTYKKWNDKDKKTKQCPICHPSLKGKYKGWNCIGFVSAALHHGMGLKNIECSCKGIGTSGFFTKVTLASWQKRNGKNWTMITNGGKKGGADIPASKLKAGDVVVCYDAKGNFHHVVLYTGNSKYIDCTNTSKKHIAERAYSTITKKYHVTRAFRYVGN